MNKAEWDAMYHAIDAASPQARVARLRAFFGWHPEDGVKADLAYLEKELSETHGVSMKGLMILAKLETLLTIEEWNTDPDTLRGKRFTGNRRGLNDLYRTVLAILEGDPQADVIARLEDLAEGMHPVIQEVESGTVYWRTKGRDKETSTKTIQNKIPELRASLKK